MCCSSWSWPSSSWSLSSSTHRPTAAAKSGPDARRCTYGGVRRGRSPERGPVLAAAGARQSAGTLRNNVRRCVLGDMFLRKLRHLPPHLTVENNFNSQHCRRWKSKSEIGIGSGAGAERRQPGPGSGGANRHRPLRKIVSVGGGRKGEKRN